MMRSSRRPRSRATARWFIQALHPRAPLENASPSLERLMLTFIPAGSFASMAVVAPHGGVAGRDVILAQLDILAAASGGTMHAVSGGAVDPFVFRLSIFVLAVFVGYFVV